ncbi:MAG: 50S ribosomal protein L35 [Planctomycetes bacterium]|nr:50S ribosomal protein L35 [Planctomycetota bacterium]MBI3846777.1 50S ribosomal protein L35 [Planctomycetota bacterium]
MPKMKSHRGLGKRVKLTKTGKLVHNPAFGSHLMSGKRSKRRRNLRRARNVFATEARKLRVLVPH